jgi:hypothetical protein
MLERTDLRLLLSALERNSLNRLVIQYATDEQCEQLSEALPKIRGLDELEIGFCDDVAEDKKKGVMKALRKNISLKKVVFRRYESEPTTEDQAKVKSYCRRNKKMNELVSSPLQVAVQQWPFLIAGALLCDSGKDLVFDLLRTLPNVQAYTPEEDSSASKPKVRENAEGRAFFLLLEGKGAVPMEIQALIIKPSSLIRQVAEGMDTSRLWKILAVLETHCGMDFSNSDVYAKAVRRTLCSRSLGNTADLALAVALVSSLTSIPVRSDTAFIGEVGLFGDLLPITEPWTLAEAARMGFTRVVVPVSCKFPELNGMEWVQCETLFGAINAGLVEPVSKRSRPVEGGDERPRKRQAIDSTGLSQPELTQRGAK